MAAKIREVPIGKRTFIVRKPVVPVNEENVYVPFFLFLSTIPSPSIAIMSGCIKYHYKYIIYEVFAMEINQLLKEVESTGSLPRVLWLSPMY